MQLHLNLSNKTKFIVELVNDEWIHNYVKKISTLELNETEVVYLGSESSDYNEFCNNLKILYDNINKIPKILLCDIPCCFPKSINDFNIENTTNVQHYLNIIHRWTTYSILRIPYVFNNIDTTKDCIISIEKNYQKTLDFLTEINQNVHAVEATFTSPGSITFPCDSHTNPYWDQGFVGDEIGREITNNTDHLFTIKNYDMWLAKRILGKDFRECWLDTDDPSCHDIVNVGTQLHYAFELDPLNNLEYFYTNEKFKNWMNTHNRSIDIQSIGNIPIGNIINKHEFGNDQDIKHALLHCNILGIEVQ